MTSFLSSAGYGAVIIFAFLQACCIPISSEITFGFAGFLASQGKLSLALVILLGALGEVAGSTSAYGLGRLGGRHTVERYRKYLLMTNRDVERAERFFDGRGSWVVAVGRILPLIRAFTGLVSGFMELPFGQFEIFNVIGTVVYTTALSLIGYALGSNWTTASKHVSLITNAVAALAVLLLILLILYKAYEMRKERRAEAALGTSAGGPVGGGLPGRDGSSAASNSPAADSADVPGNQAPTAVSGAATPGRPHSHRRPPGSPS